MRRLLDRAGGGAPPPQRLRLANKGHDTRAIQGWLGHRSITSTAVYTALAPNRYEDFWR
jgi:site-specific recombinase XerD